VNLAWEGKEIESRNLQKEEVERTKIKLNFFYSIMLLEVDLIWEMVE
jgi:hypothetical protein